jgi:hypothetical protein
MNIGKLVKKVLGPAETQPPVIPQKRSERDIYFTDNFRARATEWDLTEEHARYVFYEGDSVKGKENMKVATYKGQEIGIYVFRDRETNQPVITAIWKRQFRSKRSSR